MIEIQRIKITDCISMGPIAHIIRIQQNETSMSHRKIDMITNYNYTPEHLLMRKFADC